MPTLNSDGSASDTQTQITAASNGDTVLLPSAGSYTWSADVTMPSTKAITLDLNGSTITISGANNEFRIQAHATLNNRITNGSVIRGSGYNAFSGPFKVEDERGSAGIRVDHIAFSGGDVIMEISGKGPGVMDNCTFSGLEGAQEFIHIDGWGAGVTTGWTNDSGATLAGSASIFYIEDCTFTTVPTEANVAWIQGYYGCRVCIRYCTFNYTSVDMHGTAGNVGARWWECYENTFDSDTGDNMSWAFSFRAGSGVIYNNTNIGAESANVGLCEEDSGYPALYQPGRGLDQALDPAYVWGNTNITLELNACDAPEQPNMVQLNRDVYASARPDYTAYTYPHPLVGSSNNITFSGALTVTTLSVG